GRGGTAGARHRPKRVVRRPPTAEEKGRRAPRRVVAGGARGGQTHRPSYENRHARRSREADVERVGEALLGVPVDGEAGDAPREPLPEQIAKRLHPAPDHLEVATGDLAGHPEPPGRGDVLGARSPPALAARP